MLRDEHVTFCKVAKLERARSITRFEKYGQKFREHEKKKKQGKYRKLLSKIKQQNCEFHAATAATEYRTEQSKTKVIKLRASAMTALCKINRLRIRL